MTPAEQKEFCGLLESQLLTVWFDGKYSDNSQRWGAQEVGFVGGDDNLTDPMALTDTAAFGGNPLEAVKNCLAKRRKNPKSAKAA
jgi:hypothetical protein